MTQEENPTPIVQETPISFSVNGENLQVTQTEVNKLFYDIDRYNDQFSIGAMMGRVLKPILDKIEDPDTSTDLPTVNTEEENQQVDAFFLQSAHKETLAIIGLAVEPVSGKGATMFTSEGIAREGKMRVNVTNNERFTGFLGALEPEQIDKKTIKIDLEGLSGVLAQQVYDHYDLQAPGEEAIQLFTGLDKIVSEYKRLNMGESVNTLETYLEHGRTGDLREYIAAERRALLFEPKTGHFGPGDWQRDSSLHVLQTRWNEALSILKMAKDNPNATKLYDQLKSNLALCAEAAIVDWKATEEQHRNSEFMPYDKMLGVLEATKQKIADFDNPSEEQIPTYSIS